MLLRDHRRGRRADAPLVVALGQRLLMAIYWSIRGWLEVDDDAFTAVTDELLAIAPHDEQERLYLSRWVWRDEPMNWTRYIFYGADVQPTGLDLHQRVLERLTALGHGLEGFFDVQQEDAFERYVIDVRADTISNRPRDRRVDSPR